MAMFPVSIPPGVVRGASPNDVRGRWYDTNLVRWRQGVLEPVGGWERATINPFNTRQRKLHSWLDNLSNRHIFSASMNKVYIDSLSGFVDKTPPDLTVETVSSLVYGFGINDYSDEDYGDARSTPSLNIERQPSFWTVDNWGEDIVAVSSADRRLLYWDASNSTSLLTPVATAPTNNIATLVTPERHVMLLQAGGNPRRIAWSSREDHTDWNFASVTNTAGFIDLETSTPLLKAVNVRGGQLLFSASDVFIGRYQGLPYIYGFERIGETRIFAPDTLCTDNGMAFWWAQDGFKMFDGGAIRTLECPVWDYVASRVGRGVGPLLAHGSAHGVFPEIWFFYPSAGSLICDSYVIFNYVENWWAIGSLERSAMLSAGVDRFPYMMGENGHFYRHDSTWLGDGPGVRDVHAETSAFSIGAGDNLVKVRRALLANGRGSAATRARFFTRITPEGPEREFGPYDMRADGWTDVRVQGRDVRVRLEATQNDDWSVGEMRFDVAQGGKR